MLSSEREKLAKMNKRVSIAINADGKPYTAFAIPWEMTATAMNMCLPDVFFSKEDVESGEMQRLLAGYTVCGCYIYVPLESYAFLSGFPAVTDLTVWQGENVTSLDFLSDMKRLRMLCLEKVRLANIDVIHTIKSSDTVHGRERLNCLALYNCEIGDISVYGQEDYPSFVELVVACSKTQSERKRWRRVRALRYTYYDGK